MKQKKHFRLRFLALVLLLGILAATALSVGSAGIGIRRSIRIVWSHLPGIGGAADTADVSQMQDYIVMQVRLPRVVLAMLVGAGLSAVGGVFQGLFRNPLADPHILGVSSGAAMGATIALFAGFSFGAAGMGAVSICAFIGAVLSMIAVFLVSGKGGKRAALTMLLTGTAISTLLSAVISLLMSLNRDSAEKVYLWTLGSLSASGWAKVGWMTGIFAAGFLVLVVLAKDLNLLAMGEDTAGSLGVETGPVRILLVVFSSLMVAGAVSVSGIISFVGLVVPHCMRFLFGSDYRRLIPVSVLGGAIFLLLCDTVARTVVAPGELPVSVVTAIIGAPYFIVLIKRNVKL